MTARSDEVLSALRYLFGGHAERAPADKGCLI
jgi:hypothetical protein